MSDPANQTPGELDTDKREWVKGQKEVQYIIRADNMLA